VQKAQKTQVDAVARQSVSLYCQAAIGFDHGVGHSFLLLYDAKTSHGKNFNDFNGLGYNLSADLHKFILDHNKIYH
jgi:hypothetical protein